MQHFDNILQYYGHGQGESVYEYRSVRGLFNETGAIGGGL